MLKVIFLSLIFSFNAFANTNTNCLDYETPLSMYFDTLTNYLFSSEAKTGPFFDYLKASGIDPAPLQISPFPLKITDRTVKLFVVIDKDGTQTCATLRVPLRKMCNSVGLEYYGRARLNTDPIPASELGEMEQMLCSH